MRISGKMLSFKFGSRKSKFAITYILCFCFVDRCYTKTNGTFSGGTLPLMHRVAARQPDGLEMMPLNPVLSRCHGRDSPQLNSSQERDSAEEVEKGKAPPLSQNSPCLPLETKSTLEQQRGERVSVL